MYSLTLSKSLAGCSPADSRAYLALSELVVSKLHFSGY